MPWVSFVGNPNYYCFCQVAHGNTVSVKGTFMNCIRLNYKLLLTIVVKICKTEMLPIWRLNRFYIYFLDRSFCISYIADLCIYLLPVSFPL